MNNATKFSKIGTLIKRCFIICFVSITSNVFAQTPCNQRIIDNTDFTYTGAGAIPTRWSANQADTGGFSIDQTAFSYVAAGNFINPNLNSNGGTNNSTRQYAIVSNPNTLSPQFANIPTNGMLVINPLQGQNDQYGTYTINGLIPGNTYTVEIKVWNVIDLAMPTACGQWCNWNDQLEVNWAGNGNNPQDGLGAMTWTGTNGTGTWNGYGNQINNIMKISSGGDSAIMTAQVTLANATTGFTLTFVKGNSVNPIVLGIDYIKVYGCQQEAINISGGTPNVCEASQFTLTAQGIGPAGSSYQWFQNGVLLSGRTSDTLNVISPIGPDTTAIYKAIGQWDNISDTLISKLCCSSVDGTNDDVFTQSFNGLTYSCTSTAYGPYADIPGIGVTAFINPAYTYAGTTCNNLNDGQYAVVQNSYAGQFWRNRPEVFDHTGVAGSGALFINAVGGVGQVFYSFNLSGLCTGTTYDFSVWYASLAAAGEIVPYIEFDVVDSATGAKIATTNTGVIPTNEQWYESDVTFTTPATGSPTYTLECVNLVSGSGGNDLMMDDIAVKKCTPSINLFENGTSDSVVSVCNNNPVDLAVNTFYNLPLEITGSTTGTVYYQWMSATSPSGPWTNIGTPETIDSFSAIPTPITTYYRAKVSADYTRASNGAVPVATDCGNDAMTNSFTLTQGGNFTIPPITGTTSYCIGSTMTLTGDPGTGNEWEWAKGNSPITATPITGYTYSNNAANKVFSKTFAVSDTGNYYFFVKTAAGCETYATTTVTINPSPTATISGTTAACQNSTAPNITFTGANGTAPYIFTYAINGGSNLTATTVSGSTVTVAAPTAATGTFTYNLTGVQDALCSSVVTAQTATVTVNPLPTATISGTTSVSLNAASPKVTFTGANGTAPYTFTYNINGGSNLTVTTTTGNSITVAAPTSATGTFVYNLVSVKDASATTCSNTASGTATITVTNLPSATISGATSTCQNSAAPNITFTGSNGTPPYTFTYNINGGSNLIATTVSGSSVTVAAPTTVTGTFAYTLTNVQESSTSVLTNTVTGQSATVTITSVPAAPGTMLVQPTCASASGTITVTSPASGVSYSFDNGNTFQLTATDNNVLPGTYQVMVKTTPEGCVSASSAVTINPQPAIPSTPTVSIVEPDCATATGIITVTNALSGETYSFDNGVTFSANATSNSLASGTYLVVAKNTTGGCVSPATSATINTQPLPPAAPVATVTQPSCSVATGIITVTSPASGVQYSFNNGSSFQSSASSGNLPAGNYQLIAESIVGNCLSGTTAATINPQPIVPAAPSVTSPVNYCEGATAVPLTASGNGLTWYDASGSIGPDAPIPSTATGGSTTYYVTSSNGTCESQQSTIVVTIDPIAAYAGGPIVDVNQGQPVTLNGKASGNNYTISWSPLTYLSSGSIPNPTVTALSDITYVMNVTSTDGCKASDTVQVVVLKSLIIPNAFSPNGDGINDTWVITYLDEYPAATVSIFNRYGQLIYESSGGAYSGRPWDGTYKGSPVPVATYYYIIKLADGQKPISGDISVIR